jgi:hypothetical protein
MPRKWGTEQKILETIRNMRDEGVYQSELWKIINTDSREGSRAILRLEKKGLIERTKELHEGRWTYRLVSKHKFSSVDSIIDIPCAFCDLGSKCGISALNVPHDCEALDDWIKKNIAKAESSGSQQIAGKIA